MAISMRGALTANFIVATAIGYGSGAVPSEDPLVQLGASCAVAAVSTVCAYAATKVFNHSLFMFILGGVFGGLGADAVSDDIVLSRQHAEAPAVEPEQVSSLQNLDRQITFIV